MIAIDIGTEYLNILSSISPSRKENSVNFHTTLSLPSSSEEPNIHQADITWNQTLPEQQLANLSIEASTVNLFSYYPKGYIKIHEYNVCFLPVVLLCPMPHWNYVGEAKQSPCVKRDSLDQLTLSRRKFLTK